jgi:hypothetical protein
VLVCSEKKILLVVLREKYCWLVAVKRSEQGWHLAILLIENTMYQSQLNSNIMAQ